MPTIEKAVILTLAGSLDKSKIPVPKDTPIQARQVSALSEQMSKLTKDLEKLVATMGSLAKPTADAAAAEAYAERILSTIKSIPKVASVTMSGSSLVVDTEVLSIPFRKQRRVVGAIRITIPTNPTPGRGVRFSNLNESDLYQGTTAYLRAVHPHIDGSGHACFGEIHGSVQDMLQKQMFPELVRILMTYLQSINMNDYMAVDRANALPTKATWNKKRGVVKLT